MSSARFSQPRSRLVGANGYTLLGATPVPTWMIVLFGLTFVMALAAIITGPWGLWLAANRGPHHDPSQVENLNVTGNLTALKAVIQSIMGGNVTVGGNLTVDQHALITQIWSSHVNSTEISSHSLSVEELAVIESLLVEQVNVTSQLMTPLLMHTVLDVTNNATMPATHNHIRLSGGALQITLPAAPLTAFIGKTFTVCNTDATSRRLVLPNGMHWIPNFSQLELKEACCVTFSVTDPNRVQLVGEHEDSCLRFCTEVFCNDHPLLGWWSMVSKGANIFSDFYGTAIPAPQFMYIKLNPSKSTGISLEVYDGTVDYAYAIPVGNPTLSDYTVQIINDRVMSVHTNFSFSVTVGSVTGEFPTETQIGFVLQNTGVFSGLAWLDSMWTNSWNQMNPGDSSGFLFEKLAASPQPQIRPAGHGDNRFTDVDSRRFMFQQIDDIMFNSDFPALSGPTVSERLMRLPERRAFFNRIMDQGVTRAALPLFSIERTTKDSGTTNLLVKGQATHVNFASELTLNGLAGDWSILNGNTYSCGGRESTTGENLDNQSPFYLSSQNIYYILIMVNTSALPEFNATLHAPMGAIIQPSTVGPITEDIEYRKWLDAAIFYVSNVAKQATHAQIGFFGDRLGPDFIHSVDSAHTKSAHETWHTVASAISGAIDTYRGNARFKSARQDALIAPSYYLPADTSYVKGPVNQKFTELGIPGAYPGDYPDYTIGTLPAPFYNVPMENYILPSSRRWLYWRVKPNTPAITPIQKNIWVNGFDGLGNVIPGLEGYAAVGPGGLNLPGQYGGSRLEGLMSPTPWGVANATLAAGFWSPFTVDATFGYIDPTTFNAGLINPDLVGGRKIGYLYSYYNMIHSPGWYVDVAAEFGNPALGLDADPEVRKRQQYDGERAVIAELMRYFVTELGVESMILDIRTNGGSYFTHSIAECFGDTRKGITGIGAFQKQDFGKTFSNEADIDVYSGTTSTSKTIRRLIDTCPYNTIRPDLMELHYPGSVFKNGPLIILDSQGAGSGGDHFPWFFIGDAGDGNIGNGVHMKIVGTIDGVFDGSNYGGTSLITSQYGSQFGGSSPIRGVTRGESILYQNIAGFPTNTRYNASGPLAGLVPKNTNLQSPMHSVNNTGVVGIVDGALSTNLYDTVYFDFGYTGPGTAVDGVTLFSAGHWDNPPFGLDQVSGFPGQPNSSDVSTLRDSWLEEALRVARISLGDTLSKKKKKDTLPHKRTHTPSDAFTHMQQMMADPETCHKMLHAKEHVKHVLDRNMREPYETDNMAKKKKKTTK